MLSSPTEKSQACVYFQASSAETPMAVSYSSLQ